MIRVLLADDHALVRSGLEALLADHADLEVVAAVGTFPEAVDGVLQYRPQVAVLDIRMPGGSVLEVLSTLRRQAPGTGVLVVSGHPEEQFALRMLQAGARGYVAKESAAEELVAAIRRVAGGGRHVSATLAERLAGMVVGETPTGPPHEALSEREFQVLLALAAGRTVGEVAASLFLSPKTVSTYRARVLQKLGLRSNAELTRYALDHGLLE